MVEISFWGSTRCPTSCPRGRSVYELVIESLKVVPSCKLLEEFRNKSACSFSLSLVIPGIHSLSPLHPF